ncbi:hypothetical protein [Aestuariibacter salexigens]|uniref:hypothetical protein n=1 Tax=Aestuariibacter salexigens TaxID=226010 RepID=UPI0012EC4C54|nr:hypothetical protein [Aestuariibacter salexigens]
MSALKTLSDIKERKNSLLVWFGHEDTEALIEAHKNKYNFILLVSTSEYSSSNEETWAEKLICNEDCNPFVFSLLLISADARLSSACLLERKGLTSGAKLHDSSFNPTCYQWQESNVTPCLYFVQMLWRPIEYGSVLMAITSPGQFDRGMVFGANGDQCRLHGAFIGSNVEFSGDNKILSSICLYVPLVDKLNINIFPGWSHQAQLKPTRGIRNTIECFNLKAIRYPAT